MKLSNAVTLGVAIIVGILVVRMFVGGGVAPTPEAFVQTASFDDAQQASAQSGKPVLVFATADWCGPCQSFKRGALADGRVASAIAERTEPVYVDVDAAGQVAQQLGVRSIPDLILLREGEIVARMTGGASANQVLAWLDENAGS